MEHIRPMTSGYSDAGASEVRRALKGFKARSTSPNEDINWNNYTLRQRGRMLYMSSPIAASAIKTNRTKVVGTGLTLKSSIEHEALGMTVEAAKEWQRNTEREFAIWANKRENCDAIGMNNFAGLQQLAILSWLMSGDVFEHQSVHLARPHGRSRPHLYAVKARHIVAREDDGWQEP